jgi:MFS family permease
MANLWHNLGLNRTIIALSLARMADGIANSILFILIPLYVLKLPDQSFPLPVPLLVGVIISAYGFSASFLQPLIAAFADRWGHYKYTVELGLVILGVATFTFIYASRYLDLIGLRLLQGIGLAMEIPAAMALISLVTLQETRGGAMGFFTTMRMLGLAIGPLVGGYLHTRFGFNTGFLVATAILVLTIVIVQFGVDANEIPKSPSFSNPSPLFDRSLYTPPLLTAAAATFIMATAFSLVTTLQNEFNARLNTNAFGFSIGFSSLMIGRLIFQTLLGRLSDRFGRKPFVFYGLLVLGPITALLGEVTTLTEFSMLRFLQGIASAAIVAPTLAYAGDIVQAGEQGSAGRQISIVTTGFGLGIAIGPLIAGILATAFFQLPFWIDGLLCMVIAWLVQRQMIETVERSRG